METCDCFFDIALFAKTNQLQHEEFLLAIKQRASFLL